MTYNEYMREYMAMRYAARRAMLIALLGGECVDCGSKNLLEFDHKDRSTKSFDIGKRLAGIAKEKLMEEIKKCVLRCSLCHESKTAAESSVPHGGGVSGKKNCPCRPCRARKAEYMRNYKASRRT